MVLLCRRHRCQRLRSSRGRAVGCLFVRAACQLVLGTVRGLRKRRFTPHPTPPTTPRPAPFLPSRTTPRCSSGSAVRTSLQSQVYFRSVTSLLLVYASVLLHVQRNRRLIRDGSPGRPPRLSFTQLYSFR